MNIENARPETSESKYSEEQLLMLSGIQHIAFCDRQWALIHIEQQWKENLLTVEGQILHERSDNPFDSEKRDNLLRLRAVPLVSYTLGLIGKADVTEFARTQENDSDSITLQDYPGNWKVFPVEYKRGKPKPDIFDEAQLCAQAICLEELYGVYIDNGYLYYGMTRHRHEVKFDEVLRDHVQKYSERMHELYSKGITPLPVYKLHCKSCSLFDLCLPRSIKKEKSASDYLRKNLMLPELK
jgi:CRISPR-associated exonuclease Cas4